MLPKTDLEISNFEPSSVKHMRHLHSWVQIIVPFVYDNSLSYIEFLGKVSQYLNEMASRQNQLSGLFDNLVDYTNTSIQKQVDYINSFVSQVRAEMERFEKEMQDQYNDFTEDMVNKFNAFKNDITTQINNFETEMRNRATAFEESMTTRQTNFENRVNEDIEGLHNDWNTYQTNLNNAWDTYKTSLNSAWDTYQNNLNNAWNEYKTTMTEDWLETKTYIDNYFRNLDVETVIRQILDEMYTNGTLAEIINKQFSGVIQLKAIGNQPVTANKGDYYYDTGTEQLMYFDGTSWVQEPLRDTVLYIYNRKGYLAKQGGLKPQTNDYTVKFNNPTEYHITPSENGYVIDTGTQYGELSWQMVMYDRDFELSGRYVIAILNNNSRVVLFNPNDNTISLYDRNSQSLVGGEINVGKNWVVGGRYGDMEDEGVCLYYSKNRNFYKIVIPYDGSMYTVSKILNGHVALNGVYFSSTPTNGFFYIGAMGIYDRILPDDAPPLKLYSNYLFPEDAIIDNVFIPQNSEQAYVIYHQLNQPMQLVALKDGGGNGSYSLEVSTAKPPYIGDYNGVWVSTNKTLYIPDISSSLYLSEGKKYPFKGLCALKANEYGNTSQVDFNGICDIDGLYQFRIENGYFEGLNYLEPSTLANYVTTDDLTQALSSYATIESVNTNLENYVTTENLNSTLGGYVTNSGLTSTLSGYVTNSALNTKLASYVTTSNLNTTLQSYVTNSALNTKLASYVTNTALNSRLNGYIPTSRLSTLIDVATVNGNISMSLSGSGYGYKSVTLNYPSGYTRANTQVIGGKYTAGSYEKDLMVHEINPQTFDIWISSVQYFDSNFVVWFTGRNATQIGDVTQNFNYYIWLAKKGA